MRDVMKRISLIGMLLPLLLPAAKFYDDDPIPELPPPVQVDDAKYRKLNDYFDLFTNLFADLGEKQPSENKIRKSARRSGDQIGLIRAQAVNTLGEVPDNSWFTNRIGSREFSLEEIRKAAGGERPPNQSAPWTIKAAKTEGVTPGFRIKDSTGENYLIKFDPPKHPEMATGADIIGSSLFHALGYNVPENYLVEFHPDDLVIGEGTTIKTAGTEVPMSRGDVMAALRRVPQLPNGRIRAVASRFLPGKILGEFRYYGTRSDDPNDIVEHEHRRDLRGLNVFCAWLNHSDSRAINTLDSLVEEDGRRFVKHFLIDFGAIIGSASVVSNSARDGNAYFFSWKPMWAQMGSLGLFVPRWARAKYTKHRALGMVEFPTFEPDEWKPNYPTTAFVNRLPDDEYWAAKKVMAFSDEHIREAVKVAKYSDPAATQLLGNYLIGRRDRIGEVYFTKVLALDNFRIEGDQLAFDDLAVKHGFAEPREYSVAWGAFDNELETGAGIDGATGLTLPAQTKSPGYYVATITANDPTKTVVVYLRAGARESEIVGIERTW